VAPSLCFFGKNKQTSYLINYRYSTLSVFKALGLNIGTGTAVPIYQDVNYKFVTRPGKKSKISLFGIAGASTADFLGKDIDTSKPDLYGGNPYADQKTKFSNTITGLSYDYQISQKSSTRLVAGYSTTYQHYTNDSLERDYSAVYPNQLADFKTGKLSLQWYYNHKFSAKDNIQTGVTYENTSFNTLYKRMKPGLPDQIFNDQTGTLAQEQAFAQWRHRYSTKLSMVTGLHFQYLDINSSFAAEPRVSFQYAPNSRNSFSVGYGMHHQAQNVYTYYVQTPSATGYALTNKDLGFTRSQHIVGSFNHNFDQYLHIKTELYYQALDKVPVEQSLSSYSSLNSGATFGLDNTDSLQNKGTGTNYGAEITLERFLKNGFYFLGTLSLINSSYKGSDGISRYTAFNTEYVANVLAGKEFKVGKKGNLFAVNIKVSRIGGRYLTPLDSTYSRLAGTDEYVTSKAFSLKQDDYFRTDIKLSYKKEYKHSTMEFSIDLQNITNHKNIFSQSYDTRTNKVVKNYQQGFFPVPFFRYTF
ncbi:MAG: TonB-dependent receptor, partial [Chitinophagia bacterium]|nr:TonB-dependent receptor [Chitinophagia bacterium]